MDSEAGQVWAVCEQFGDALAPCSLELLGQAARLAQAKGSACGAVIFGPMENEAAQAFAAGADIVYELAADRDEPGERGLALALASAVKQYAPESAVFSATVRGRSLAPQTAALLRTGLTADCTGLEIQPDGLLVQTRPAFGNTLMARIVCETARPQMASVRPGVFPLPTLQPGKSGRIVRVELEKANRPLPTLLSSTRIDSDGRPLSGADIVISGGMGVRPETFEKIEQLAHKLGGAAGASRAAVHAGLAPYAHQVGQTGVAVRPRLYIALGISGAIQHQAGMAGAECIIAVNTDAKAPIFSIAHYGLVWDAAEFVDAALSAFS